MGVPIGDVARVSQVLLAQLQQSRDTSSGRTGVSGVLSQDSLSTAQIQSSGNVESIDGFFKGDGGLLSNVGLQRVTEIDSSTNKTIQFENKDTGLTVSSNAIVQGDFKLLGSMYYNNNVIMNTMHDSIWKQLGGDINGEGGSDMSGWSVSLSADGTRVAIGANGNDGVNGADSGHTRVYEWYGGAWTQLGGDIDGEAAGDMSSWSVSLSADGYTGGYRGSKERW